MNNFNYFSANEVYRSLYYQLPKVLFTSNLYKNMSNDSKIAYALLQDRCEYSIANNWVDEDGYLFFIFTVKELQDILNCGNKKVAKIKKELESFNLLLSKKTAPQKRGDKFINMPDRLYLGKLEVNPEDIYTTSNNNKPFSESVETTSSKKTHKNSISAGSVQMTRPEKTLINQCYSESVQMTRNQYKTYNILDTYKDTYKDTVRDATHELEELSYVIEQSNNLYAANFPIDCKNIINKFNLQNHKKTFQQIGIILRAKKEISKQYNQEVIFEKIQNELLHTTKVIFNEIYKSNKGTKNIKNENNYIYASYKKFFENIAFNQQLESELQTTYKKDLVPMIDYTIR